ncbi:SH3 domain-containing protein [Streptomyces sp. NPDC029674]|uniref:SH3 domain-containing protein n=1 Tax=Streptomyces sp. NPDC029674 TaxID=3365297 RepID=UPI0038513768
MMSRKGLRALVVSGAAVAGLGMFGVSAASAMPLPGPVGVGGGGPRSVVSTGTGSGHAYADGKGTYGESASVTVNGLRVRGGPGTTKTVMGLIYKGERVKLVGARQDSGGQLWHRVVLKQGSAGGLPRGSSGWVSAAYLY